MSDELDGVYESILRKVVSRIVKVFVRGGPKVMKDPVSFLSRTCHLAKYPLLY